MSIQQTITPVDNSVYVERELHNKQDIHNCLKNARAAQKNWKLTNLEHRKEIITKFASLLLINKQKLAEEITWQMGRPISQTPNEIDGAVFRTNYLLSIADSALADTTIPNNDPYYAENLTRKIKHNPVGVVFIIAPWNYPYLTTVNTLIPALLAGNSVIIKHSSQTPLCSENIVSLLLEAGLPEYVCQYLHLSHEDTNKIIADNLIDYVTFTGSVTGGKQIAQALSHGFHSASLELGGKDAAYVKQDTDLNYTVQQLVDGVYFNSGQSCCGVERIYVDQRIYSDFVNKFVALTSQYKLANPTTQEATLGPMVKKSAADHVRQQINKAINQGAQKLVDKKLFRQDTGHSPYLAPQVLINVDHTMDIMVEETFGPVVGIMPVESDTQALELINDSRYGLTCSLWTQDSDYAEKLFQNIDVGTCLLNKCDYLDPALAWTGVKDSGYGCSLSSLGFAQITRPKSYYLLNNKTG